MPPEKLQIYDKVRFQEIETNIIENVVLENVKLEVQDFYEMAEANTIVSRGEPFCLLLEFEPFASVSKEYMEIAKSFGKSDGLMGTAMLTKNLAHKIAGDVYLKIRRPANLTKLFRSKELAVSWLKERKEIYQNAEKNKVQT